jgi:uncharacterized membrane protein
MIPRDRIEALTDGIFGFAMTLLVTALVLPDGFLPTTNGDLLAALGNLDSGLIAYAISFVVLAVRWSGIAASKGVPDEVSGSYFWAVIIHLFFITTMPFSTMVIGRYGDFPAAVWLYSANMALSAMASLAMSFIAERDTGQKPDHSGRIDLIILIISALLSGMLSHFIGDKAMWAYLLNFAKPLADRVMPATWRSRLD